MIGALIAKLSSPRVLEALNRRDIESYLNAWADDAILVYPGDVPGVSGVYNGKAAIRAFYERELEQFPSIHLTPRHVAVTNLFDLTGRNVIVMQWDAEVTNSDGFTLSNSGTSVLTIRRGKVIHAHIYIFDTGEAFRTAWGEGGPPKK